MASKFIFYDFNLFKESFNALSSINILVLLNFFYLFPINLSFNFKRFFFSSFSMISVYFHILPKESLSFNV